jgi:hypothetical protein
MGKYVTVIYNGLSAILRPEVAEALGLRDGQEVDTATHCRAGLLNTQIALAECDLNKAIDEFERTAHSETEKGENRT